MNAVPVTSLVPGVVTNVFIVLELLPPLTAKTKPKVLAGNTCAWVGTGVSGIHWTVSSPLLGKGLRPVFGSGVPVSGCGVPPVGSRVGTDVESFEAGEGVSVGPALSFNWLWDSWASVGVTSTTVVQAMDKSTAVAKTKATFRRSKTTDLNLEPAKLILNIMSPMSRVPSLIPWCDGSL